MKRLDGSSKILAEAPAPQSLTHQQQAAQEAKKTVVNAPPPVHIPLPRPPPRVDGEVVANGVAKEEGPKGMKRDREEFEEVKKPEGKREQVEDEGSDVPMEEDDDEGSAMEESDDDD